MTVVGTADELTGQAVYSFVTLKPEFKYDESEEAGLIKELTLQVRKVIGPFAAPKKIFVVGDLPKTRSGKVRASLSRARRDCVLSGRRTDVGRGARV